MVTDEWWGQVLCHSASICLFMCFSWGCLLKRQVRTLQLRPMATDAGKAVVEQQLGTPKALHRMHAHIAPDGRTVIGCQLSHRDLPDLRQLRDGQVRP